MTAPNAFTQGSIPRVFLRAALPIIFLTSINGLLTVADAVMLGAFVGPDALTAVTVTFPATMLLAALATMVSSGMASTIARLLGGGRVAEARRHFAGAHGLALLVCLAAMLLFALAGEALLLATAGGSLVLAELGHAFLGVAVVTSPLLFLLSLHSDALRAEGRIGFMAAAGLLVSLSNLAFNALLILGFGLGVAGSAWGTALAQALALAVIVAYRARGKATLGLARADIADWRHGWGETLSLGAPRSLSFIGIALGAASTIFALRLFGGADRESTIAAYGVITRMMTFAYLPLLGMSLALQAVVGNNYGAGLWARSNAALKLALVVALAYCAVVETVLMLFRAHLGALFVADPAVIAEVARILPIYALFYFTLGPMMIIAGYYQSIGDARRSALLSLARTYVFAVPLTFILPGFVGETGIWLALPLADLLLVAVTAATLRSQSGRLAWGLFRLA